MGGGIFSIVHYASARTVVGLLAMGVGGSKIVRRGALSVSGEIDFGVGF